MKKYRTYSIGVVVAVSMGMSSVSINAERTRDTRLQFAPDSLICRTVETGRPLPEQVRETSGIAQSRVDPNLFWTHNDSGGGSNLFALTSQGILARHVRVGGAAAVDWEDIESGPCARGSCLYIADTGDNAGKRKTIDIYRIPEPALTGSEPVQAVRLSIRYPDKAQDAEAMFVSPAQEIFLVTKGRHGPVALYKLPTPHDDKGISTLIKVRELFPQPTDELDRVTSATMSPDGNWVMIRTYRNLHLYRAATLLNGAPSAHMTFSLAALAEAQGEAVAMSNDGSVWLSSEAEDKRMMPTWSRLSCSLPVVTP
jgi:hypothetical protein